MLTKKPLILTLIIAFFVHCANGRAQENRLPLRFALAVGKALINKYNETPQARVRFGNNQPIWIRLLSDDNLKIGFHSPDLSQVCFSPHPDVEAKACSQAASDEDSDSEDNGSSDESSDNCSEENEEQADTETNVPCVNTTPNPFQVLKEFSQYCTTLKLKMIEQGAISDSEVPTESEAKVTRLGVHQCDHEGCNYISLHLCHLNRHKHTHLPADQRFYMHHCDHEGCNYRTNHGNSLKRHKQIHLPADQRLWEHQCDHEGCNYRTNWKGNLKTHKQTHLPADQRPKAHKCDHEGCNYSSDRKDKLKRHKQTHLPFEQRLKRKVSDQPPSNEKRKKSDKE